MNDENQKIVNKYIEDKGLQPLVSKIERFLELCNSFDKEVDTMCEVLRCDFFESPVASSAYYLIDFISEEMGIGDWLSWWMYGVGGKPSEVVVGGKEFVVKDVRDLVFVAHLSEEDV